MCVRGVGGEGGDCVCVCVVVWGGGGGEGGILDLFWGQFGPL